MSVESINLTATVNPESITRSKPQTMATSSVSAVSNSSKQESAPEISVEKLTAAVDKLNDLMKNDKRALNFSVDQDAGKVVVKVFDQQTEELIRQIPTEESLKLAEHLEGLMGLIFSDKA